MGSWAQTALRIATRTLATTVLWLIIDEGDLGSLVVGVPLSLIAAAVSVRLYPNPLARVSLTGILRFARYFVVQSFLGGLDVASRAFRPSMPLDPGNLIYVMRLPSTSARVLFLNVVSLLPGTLSSELAGDRLHIHALDVGQPVERDLRRLEQHVADIFGLELHEHEKDATWND